MKTSDQSLWPYKPKISIIITVVLLTALLILIAILRFTTGWPTEESMSTIIIGILCVSFIPVLLTILDLIISRGGSIGYGDFKIDFSKVRQSGSIGFTVPANIGTRGQQVLDSGPVNILDTLHQAASSSVAVIDLEDGEAWWETRLLVFLSGAQRLGSPDKVVFIATQGGRTEKFLGWGSPGALLKKMLVNQKYAQIYYRTKAIADQWRLVPPVKSVVVQNPPLPTSFPWMTPEPVNQLYTVFNMNTGLPSELFEEQTLQNELTNEIERPDNSGKPISSIRLSELFDAVLRRNSLDQNHSAEEQSKNFFSDDEPYMALTQAGRYISMVSRFSIYNELLKKPDK